MIENKQLPPFQPAFLKPRYWGLWLGIGIFKLILALPYPMLVLLGKGLGKLFAKLGFGKHRIRIAKRNLELCFPDYTHEQIEQILAKNIESGRKWKGLSTLKMCLRIAEFSLLACIF